VRHCYSFCAPLSWPFYSLYMSEYLESNEEHPQRKQTR
jgi:hypothetical protein